MSKTLKIGIIGCGTAGLSAAAYLKKNHHDVEIFERFEHPKPLGAGLMIQPTGLACLAVLGLDRKAIEYGATINNLYGTTASKRVIFDISYRNLRLHYFGLGIHRGALFSILYDEVNRLGVPVRTNCEITKTHIENDQRYITTREGERYGPYDLVIDASGARSPLRPDSMVKLNKPYPYGAIWGVLDDPDQAFCKDFLLQRYDSAHIMIGMLAIGKEPGYEGDKAAFFWSLPPGGYDKWLAEGLTPWKDKVMVYWPELAPFLDQFTHTDDLTFASYSDIILKHWHDDRLIFIGDSGHNTSPQLGQGANLALADALVLSRLLQEYEHVNDALSSFSKMRKNHIYFYQIASRWLTPFFQSHSKPAGWIRDMSFGLLCKTPYVKTEMLKTLGGLKTGLFTNMNPGVWHKRYDFYKPE